MSDKHTNAPKATSASRIPSEAERPAFVVLDDWHDEQGHKMRPGVWHFGSKPGKQDGPPHLTQTWVCSPLHIDAVTTDAHDGSYGRLLRFKNTLGNWVTWAMPMEMLRADGADLRGQLLNTGVEISPYPAARNLLAVYLQDKTPKRRLQCVLQIGWAGADCRAFALPDGAIGPKASSVTYQSEARGSEEYTQAGALADWRLQVAALAVGNPMLVLGISTAFAGPLLKPCNAESGGAHLIGDSSTGKTTILEAATSVWGGPNYRRSWRATSNGLEAVAALFNDSLLALDEISESDPEDVGEVVYMLGNGRGKQRAGRTGGARAVTRWACAVLSTGERSIATTMADGGQRIKAGQAVRLLDIPVERKHGAWDTLHSHTSGAAFSNALKRASATHYGHAGRAFLEQLSREETDPAQAWEAIKALPEFQPTSTDGQAARAAGRFALLALAGELATGYGVTGWPEGEAIRAAVVAFKAWLSMRGTGGNTERVEAAERLLEFIDRHGDSRFSDADAPEDARAVLVRDRAGYWRNTAQGRVYLFTATGMREALKGLDFNRALLVLEQADLIGAPNDKGERARSQRVGGRKVRVYEVHPDGVQGAV